MSIETECRSKIRYETWQDAEADAARIAQQELAGLGGLLLAYYCKFNCGFWHLGHIPWRQLRRGAGQAAMRRFRDGRGIPVRIVTPRAA